MKNANRKEKKGDDSLKWDFHGIMDLLFFFSSFFVPFFSSLLDADTYGLQRSN